ncbi:unnamed protein product [Cyclocybe aegerita]|uniref:F-box domain-containing protein n=1 Tax=Cyclocybe aegerita TaxID=1973307 RepID=A0A8S0WEC2_CYCAE|nr:unnamed protein product [Cyclocybe aegerita]
MVKFGGRDLPRTRGGFYSLLYETPCGSLTTFFFSLFLRQVTSMSFLHRQRSHQTQQTTEKEAKRSSKFFPSPAAVENVPQKRKRQRTSSSSASGASRIMRRVSSMFLRKKTPSDLKQVNTALANSPRRLSRSSSRGSFESEDDIRRPSGLGRAVSISSNRSLPPSPFTPSFFPHDSFPTITAGEFQRIRAVSSPNLLQSTSFNIRGMTRRASVVPNPLEVSSPKRKFHLPEVVIIHILSHLPPQSISRCASASRLFASAARTSLYTHIDTEAFSLSQVERVVVLLASRSDLTDLVSTFVCSRWPAFFLSDTRLRDGHSIQQQDALLTATFTLALERMSNLVSLTLPAFDASLLAQHTAFGLTRLTFLNPTMSEAETTALFTWLDGQTNITTLCFPNLEDSNLSSPLTLKTNLPEQQSRAGTAPSSPHLKPFPTLSPYATPIPSPSSAYFNVPPSPQTPSSPFNSPTLLPNLAELHATPSLLMHLFPSIDTIRRPLKAVSLNITTTLYSGLRPAALMSSLRGINRLSLRFSDSVDRRSFEKVIGAAGAALGCPSKDALDDPFSEPKGPLGGLQALEISFPAPATAKSGRDEALYKSLQASLPRYKSLSSLRLSISSSIGSPARPPSSNEKILIDAWIKLCPTLSSVTLFSNSRWQPPPTAL